MRFQWDEENLSHIARHAVAPEEAEQVIDNEPFDLEIQFVNSEERLLQIGITTAGRILMVASTSREDELRVITAFPASPGFRQLYLKQKVDADAKARDDNP